MEARPALRLVASSTSALLRPTSTTTTTTTAAAAATVRHASTVRAQKKALKIPPHPSFLTPPGSPAGDQIVFNPPSAAPSVYHTPFKFLPPSDPRRFTNLNHLLRAPSSSELAANADLPQPANKVSTIQPRRNVTPEEVEEMRRLRDEDPAKWSVLALARRFNCSNYFVMMCCKASAEHRKSEYERLEAIKARWGPIRSNAREERKKRRVLLHRDQL